MSGHWERLVRIVERYNKQQRACDHNWVARSNVASSGTDHYDCPKCGAHKAIGIDPGAWS
jgi:hypothetical protein